MRFFEAGVLEACLRALRTFRGLSSAVELFRRILHMYSTYSSKEAFLEEMSQLCTNIGGAQQWLSDVMADVVGDPQRSELSSFSDIADPRTQQRSRHRRAPAATV